MSNKTILVAALAVSREVPRLRWFAVLLSGGTKAD